MIPELKNEEWIFIIDSLNFYWNDAVLKLQKADIGDIEKRNLLAQKETAFRLMKFLLPKTSI